MKQVLDISFMQLGIAYVFVVMLLVIVKVRGINREKQILISCIRMTLQLSLMGYVLLYVFSNPSWWLTSLMVAVMIGFSIFNIHKRSAYRLSRELGILVAASMIIGTLVTIGVFIVFVVQVKPWYDPQYFIPITGMIIGNSMTGITLGLNRLCTDMREKKAMVENSLMLGATVKDATRGIVDGAFDTALLPTINSMVGMGIISLPGMMTGQILSGTLPTTAIKYQIGIMLAITGSVALTVIIFVTLGYRTFFNKNDQMLV